MNYQDFSKLKKKNHVSNLEMLRNSIASLYLLVFQYKEGIVLHSICNHKTDHLFKKRKKKKKKGSQNEMFAVFLYFSLKEYLAN